MFKNKGRAYIIILAAIFMAGSAAFFSVTGLSKLSSGAGISMIIFAASMEFSKLIMASFLHKRWKYINKFMRVFCTLAVCIMIMLTSVGIYGVLSSGYAKTSADYQLGQNEIALKESEKSNLNLKIDRIESAIENKTNRIDLLNGQRVSQEGRLDSLYNRRVYSGAQRTEKLIGNADSQIAKLNIEIDSLNNEIEVIQNGIASADSSIIIMQSKMMQGESAPLQYVAKMVNKPMDTVVNWFFLLIIFIFDPIAVLLFISYNIEIERAKKENEENEEEKDIKKDEKPKKEEEKVQEIIESKEEGLIEPEFEKEVITYKNDTEGNFIVSEEKEAPQSDEKKIKIFEKNKNETSQKITLEKKDLYIRMLDILMNQGLIKVGEKIVPYRDFVAQMEMSKFFVQEVEIDNFLSMCFLHGIIAKDGNGTVAKKSYEDATKIFQEL